MRVLTFAPQPYVAPQQHVLWTRPMLREVAEPLARAAYTQKENGSCIPHQFLRAIPTVR